MNLYQGQTASVRVENKGSEEIQIKNGVRQDSVLSLVLFNRQEGIVRRDNKQPAMRR